MSIMMGIVCKEIDDSINENIVDFYEQNIVRNAGILAFSGSSKFNKDELFCEIDNYIIIINGVILNALDLKKKYKCNSMQKLIVTLYNSFGDTFFNNFRGNFSGYFEDKKFNKILIFTNHSGDETVFYLEKSKKIIFSSIVSNIIDYLKYENEKIEIDLAGAYSMLTYAYMYDDITLIKGIKRLLPGNYIKIVNNNFDIKEYYQFNNTPNNKISENEAIDEIDRLFTEAVQLQLKKNEEYGLLNIAPLSAGLDSRMTNYVLRKLYKGPIYNITYSETGQLDFSIPSEISRELQNHWIFKNLDNGLALYDIDTAAKLSDTLIYYGWTSQLNDFIKCVDKTKMGIIHTGVIGDVIIGTFFRDVNGNKKYSIGDGAYSKRLLNKLGKYIKEKDYPNYEIGMLYNRALNGATLGYSKVFQQCAEAMSPFMNVEFLNYCMQLPLEFRLNHNIYYKWVKKYYPEATKYSHNGLKITTSKYALNLRGKSIKIDTIPSRIKNICKNKLNKIYGMNPLDYWYDSNSNLKEYMDDYLDKTIYVIKNNQELKNDVLDLYNVGSVIEKTQALSLVAIIKNFEIEA